MKGINLDKLVNLEKNPTTGYIKEVIDKAKHQGSEMIFGLTYIEIIQNYKKHFSRNSDFNESELNYGENQLINAVRTYNSINSFGSRN